MPSRTQRIIDPEPYQFDLDPLEVADLKSRLAATRWPDQLEDAGWDYGTEKSALMAVADHWANQYDFARHFAWINSFPHFLVTVLDDVNLHFIHARSDRADAKPLLLLHGWPGSFVEFLKIIPALTNPTDPADPAFHLVIPSIPGFGFSPAPREEDQCLPKNIVRAFNALMVKLGIDNSYRGYTQYFAQGGDWGSLLGRVLAIEHPLNCIGLHINMLVVPPPVTLKNIPSLVAYGLGKGHWFMTPQEVEWVNQSVKSKEQGKGYQMLHGYTPQTFGYALNDSPVGLLGILYGAFHHLDPDQRISLDEVLTDISLYWFTQTITTSMWLYRGGLKDSPGGNSANAPMIAGRITVPVGVAVFPRELYKMPQSWAKNTLNIQHWSVMERGGHFAALEEPDLLVGDIRKCFGSWIQRGIVQF
ncbi:epocide hydrolase domain-containing protein [Blastocladiella britannica]|nr:epocide hydrolase domain-containing protein [Blastocladiella britannica]